MTPDDRLLIVSLQAAVIDLSERFRRVERAVFHEPSRKIARRASVLEMAEAGQSVEAIAEAAEVTPETVTRILRRYRLRRPA